MCFVCPQTYIFTDGEDEELKKKIGEFYEGVFIFCTGNRETVFLKKAGRVKIV